MYVLLAFFIKLDHIYIQLIGQNEPQKNSQGFIKAFLLLLVVCEQLME